MTAPLTLCDTDQSLLVVIDIQPRLVEAMPEQEAKRMMEVSAMLLQAAAALSIPLLVTEQYPQGLGSTCQEIATHLPEGITPIGKTGFACTCAEAFQDQLRRSGRRQIILTGQETHVCVLQTAAALQAQGKTVFVVEDAVCSRRPEHKVYALERMRQAGIIVLSGESVLFEWLRDFRHPQFKPLARLIC